VATSYDSKEFCQKYKLPTLIDMENLAPQSNENNKFLTQVDGQDTFDFDKNLDDNGIQFNIIFSFQYNTILVIYKNIQFLVLRLDKYFKIVH
jgi:hypothetical protein